MIVTVAQHPLLEPKIFETQFPGALGEMPGSAELFSLLNPTANVPVTFAEDVKPAVRDLLRHGGYKPTGRGKPASEYLRQAVEKQRLTPINACVDICNVVSYHSGLPISVVDMDKLEAPMTIKIAPENTEYVFNASEQTIKLDGLICLFDGQGACANGVKDSQRTKTSTETTNTLSIVWGTKELLDRTHDTLDWYTELLEGVGAVVTPVSLERE